METHRLPVALRVTLVRPPAGVAFCIQGRDRELLHRTQATGRDLSFDLTVLAARVGPSPRFFGDVTQGPPAARFVYVCSGSMAGQAESCWTRRAKVALSPITWRNRSRPSSVTRNGAQRPPRRMSRVTPPTLRRSDFHVEQEVREMGRVRPVGAPAA